MHKRRYYCCYSYFFPSLKSLFMILMLKLGELGNIISKLYISKTFNNIDWNFLFNILHLFSFSQTFTNLISNIIMNVWYSILLNCKAHDFFTYSQGLRQGDHLSPALSILAIEYLNRTFNYLLTSYPKTSFKMKGDLQISHLSFADDFIIFYNSYINNIKKLKDILSTFEKESVLSINYKKSCFISSNFISNHKNH